ncbi:MAG: hypothetical protein V7K26_11245 [Nostoc sp.]
MSPPKIKLNLMEFSSILTEQIAIANQLQDYSTYFWMRFLNDWLF